MSVPDSVLVTGANRGIGLEIVRQLLGTTPGKPKCLFATCRNPNEAHELKALAKKHSSLHVLPVKDIRDYASYDSLVQKVAAIVGDDGLNLLINNAGVLPAEKELDATTRDILVDTFEINTVSPLLLVKAFLPLLKRAAAKRASEPMSPMRAAVVNVTSKMGSIEDNGSGSSYAYRASKAALNIITKSLSVDLKNDGIAVACIHPGWVQTDMGGKDKATLTVSDSTRAILQTVSSLTDANSGSFFNFDGNIIPW